MFSPEEVGPLDVQVANGVVDVAVADEAEAVQVATPLPVVLQDLAAGTGGSRPASAA